MREFKNKFGLCVLPLAIALAACGSGENAPQGEEATGGEIPEAADSSAMNTSPTEDAATDPVEESKAADAAPKETQAAKSIPIRGKGSIEEKCLARVGKETGARVIGTNRIEEVESVVDVHVNIEGAEAPWRCRANRDGTIRDIMYTGDEGAA